MRCALAPRVDLGARALVSGPPHSPLRRASQAIEEATGKIYNGKGKDGKKIDKGAAAESKSPPPPPSSVAAADLGACATFGRVWRFWLGEHSLRQWPALRPSRHRLGPLGLAAPNAAGATASLPGVDVQASRSRRASRRTTAWATTRRW